MHPIIIQGGMGVGVSNWRLARAVSQAGQLGVVSGTALEVIVARRLQEGDPAGDLRRAFGRFPIPGVAERALRDYFVPGGKQAGKPFKATALPSIRPTRASLELTMLANFAEVDLAKENHPGPIGINYLQKVQLPTLPSLYGAMLAGVNYVLMGAGIPMAIPGILDRLAQGEAVRMRADVEGALPDEEFECLFDPADFFPEGAPELKRPFFFPIISSDVLAATLARKASGRVDGFVVEGGSAGGHNAPPRGPKNYNQRGEPIYGRRDVPDLEKIRALGLPFWLAGSYATPERLASARAAGATGVQVGTAFAFCKESGIASDFKARVIQASADRRLDVFTDPLASPTGFPFKVIQVEGTISDPDIYARRARVCDLGYLRHAYRKADGSVGYRCPAEPEQQYVAKGGTLEETVGRKCMCNGLISTVGLGQVLSDSSIEPALLTAGDDALRLDRFLTAKGICYSAADVIGYMLSE